MPIIISCRVWSLLRMIRSLFIQSVPVYPVGYLKDILSAVPGQFTVFIAAKMSLLRIHIPGKHEDVTKTGQCSDKKHDDHDEPGAQKSVQKNACKGTQTDWYDHVDAKLYHKGKTPEYLFLILQSLPFHTGRILIIIHFYGQKVHNHQ